MIGRRDARELLQRELRGMDRMGHADAVAQLMESLARQLGGDPETWYLTGFLHDIDLAETKENMRMHGILARDKLEGLLPAESIEAIMSHDPHTGIEPTSAMARALVFSDVLDNTRRRIGMERIAACTKSDAWEELREEYPDQASHLETLRAYFRACPTVRIG